MTETTVEIKQDSLPATFEEVTGLAKAFVTSGYFSDTKQLAQAIVKIQAGRELGLAPVYSMQNINLIRNRLCSSASTLALLVKRSGRYNYRIKEHTDTACSITFYESDAGKWVEVGESKFTIEDAKRAELVKPDSGWIKYPRAMLFSRAISQGARIYCPDAIGGIYTDEEIRSIPPKPEENQQPEVIEIGQTPKSEPMPPPTEEMPAKVAIDMNWLKESLESLNWNTVSKWLYDNYKIPYGKSVAEMVKQLSPEQAQEFVKEVQRRLDEERKEQPQ